MNEYHFPIVCGLWDNGGGLVFMYEFMHVCMNVCISLYNTVYVYRCACMHVFVYVWRMTSSTSKPKQNS